MGAIQTIMAERRTYSEVGCSHDHLYAQLIVPLTGALFIETRAHQFELDESSVFFLPPRSLHYFYARDRNEFLILDIPAHLVSDLADGEVCYGIRTNFEARWSAIRTLLLAEIDGQCFPGETSPTPQTGSLLHLVHYINGLLTQSRCAGSLHYIRQHYHHPLDVAQLAQMEGYSRSYYSEWFKAQTGKSPKAYIQDLRLKQAKELLQYTDLPIYQIAQQVGFELASSLTRLFQQRDGVSPQCYRAKTRNSAN